LNRQFKGNDISSSAHEHIRQRADFWT
jgi:site-specific DNA-methyltransferase (adenine-specific)